MQQGIQHARRKRIYEALHPETVSVNKKGGPGRGNKTTTNLAVVLPAYAADASQATGDQRQEDIAKALGVSQSTVANWLSRTLKEEKERKRDKAFALWLACHTQEEIAEAVDVAVQTASNRCEDFSKSSEIEGLEKWTDFDLPIYNVWKQQSKTAGVNHFGNSEVRWLACHTQEEIAEAVDVPQQTIADWMKDFTETSITEESVKWTDFETPIYNIWKQQSKTAGVNHFGNSEVRWLDNLLYLYVAPTRAGELGVCNCRLSTARSCAHGRGEEVTNYFSPKFGGSCCAHGRGATDKPRPSWPWFYLLRPRGRGNWVGGISAFADTGFA